MRPPPTKFARSGDARIAYQGFGEGSIDLVVVGGPGSHLDLEWDEPFTVRSFERLAPYVRLVRFDRRGTGLSDPSEGPPTLEQQMADLDAVTNAAGATRPALMGAVEAGLCAMYAASYPERVRALVLLNVSASGAMSEEQHRQLLNMIDDHWGEGSALPLFAPSRVGDALFENWWARYERAITSPSMMRRTFDMSMQTDLSGVLPSVRVPTLVLHSTDNLLTPVERGREVAALVPGARFVEIPGGDLYGWGDPDNPGNDEIEEFLTGHRRAREPERVLATVLFTDIVGSTDHAARIGDRAWRELLDRHNEIVRKELTREGGHERKTLGDGFLATFDGPARAVRCARAITAAVADLGIQVRAGLHTGECELVDGDVAGIAVHLGARIGALAHDGEVLVSSTVKDLVVGSELRFAGRGVQALRGVPGEWRLYSLVE